MKDMKRVGIGSLAVTLWLLLGMLLPIAVPASDTDPAGGTGPDDPLAPSGDWVPLNAAQSHWYGFYHPGHGSQVDVRLQVEPEQGATFAVWTPQEIHDWGAGLEVEPIGRGSPDPLVANALVWSGSFELAGTYYVVVEHGTAQPGTSYYLLEINGEGISFAPPSPAKPAASEPTGLQPKPASVAAPTGKLVFQTTPGGQFYTINADGSELRRISDGIDPIWSPDGTQIAFTRWREPRGLWVVDANNPASERRVFDWNQVRWPSWSPDAAELLFSRMTGAGRQEEQEWCFRGFCFTFPAHPHWRLGVIGLADGALQEPPSSEVSHAPHWSPDGRRVVYDDVQGLRIQSLDGEVSYLVTQDANDTGPAWSPDGGRVVFVRRQHDHWEVYRVDADGRNLRRLTDTPKRADGAVGNSAAPAWSPDGQYIAFLTDRGGKWEIWVMRSDGSQQRPMFPGVLDSLPLEYGYIAERAISWTQ